MFTLLTPSALLALLGLLVPLAIHLWNRRPGRTVQVGSVRWLAASANRRLRSLKLEQLLLLLLRAAVVAVLAVALAGPVWQRPAPPTRGQVLVSPELLTSANLPSVRPLIDSLRRKGYILGRLTSGFPEINEEEWTALLANPAAADSAAATESGFLWARAAQAAQRFPERPVHLLTPARLADLQGTRPNLPPNLTWQLIPTPDSSAWIQAAALSGTDKLRLLIGRSDEEKTTFKATTVAQSAADALITVPGLPPLRYENRRAGQPEVRLATDTAATPVLRAPRLWVYYSANQAEDARYLSAALRAAGSGLLVPPVVTVSAAAPTPTDSLDWVFWLSEAPMPAAWKSRVSKGLAWWQQAPGPGVPTAASFGTAGTDALIPILRRDTAAILPPSTVTWADGAGQAVLSRRVEGLGQIYRMHTRLNPTWSGLADSPELPTLLLELLEPATPALAMSRKDYRAVALTQVQAAIQPKSPTDQNAPQKAAKPAADTFTDLRPWAVLMAGLLFGLERLLAQRRPIPTPVSPA
ncbi:BatA domain-containing protein [Hymenobacter sp. HD11105]